MTPLFSVYCLALSANAAMEDFAHDTCGIRAVWLTTLDGLDWPATHSVSAESMLRQQREFTDMLDSLRQIGINTVLLQTRIRGTVIYPSAAEPWDACLTGRAGSSPGYDPLAFAINECHRRGMELHAWVVAIPLGKWNSPGCRTMRRKNPQAVKQIKGYGYLNPDKPQTGDIIAAICSEITRNYEIDGIHLDYIRYPETWKLKISPTQARANITSIVRKVHDAVRAAESKNQHVKLSCSPIGKRCDLARYSSHGWNALRKGCQDVQAWLRDGLMDQLYPMMYFRDDQFFPFALDWMENSYGKDIVAGLGIYFLDRRYGDWCLPEIVRQINVAESTGMGVCFFRAKFLLDNTQGIYDYMRYVHNYSSSISNAMNSPASLLTPAPAAPPAQEDTIKGFLHNDGKLMDLPSKGNTLDADYVMFETLQGQTIAVRPFRESKADITAIPDGIYFIKSLGRKSRSHRLGMTIIKRK